MHCSTKASVSQSCFLYAAHLSASASNTSWYNYVVFFTFDLTATDIYMFIRYINHVSGLLLFIVKEHAPTCWSMHFDPQFWSLTLSMHNMLMPHFCLCEDHYCNWWKGRESCKYSRVSLLIWSFSFDAAFQYRDCQHEVYFSKSINVTFVIGLECLYIVAPNKIMLYSLTDSFLTYSTQT